MQKQDAGLKTQPTQSQLDSLRKTNLATTKLFSPDCSGILPTLMAMQAVAGRSIEITGMRPDTIDCTPAARQIQAVGGIGYQKLIVLNTETLA